MADRKLVKIIDPSIKDMSLAVSTSAIYFDSSDESEYTVDVTTTYNDINFSGDMSESGFCEADSCISLSGTRNDTQSIFSVSISATTESGDTTIDILSDKTNHEFKNDDSFWLKIISSTTEVTTSGGSFVVSLNSDTNIGVNKGEDDRHATIIVTYDAGGLQQMKKIQVTQFANMSYVTYIVTSDAMDGAKVIFNDDVDNPVYLTDGMAEYTMRKITADSLPSNGWINVYMEGGLPSSGINYTLATTDGVTSTTVSKSDAWCPSNLSGYSDVLNYSYSQNIVSANTTVNIYYNYSYFIPIYTINNGNPIEPIKVADISYDWIESANSVKKEDGYICDCIKIGDNTGTTRSAVLTYYLENSPSTTLRYKIMQSQGDYQFYFKKDGSKRMTLPTEPYYKHQLADTIEIVSTLNDTPIDFTYVSDSNVAQITKTNNIVTISLNKNYYTSERNIHITFIQSRSNQTIRLTIPQEQVQCQVADTYAYNMVNHKHGYFSVNAQENIEDGFTPIGIVLMPFDNNAPYMPEYARIISLTERKEGNHDYPYCWDLANPRQNADRNLYQDKNFATRPVTRYGYEAWLNGSHDNEHGESEKHNDYEALGSISNTAYKKIPAFDGINGQLLYYGKIQGNENQRRTTPPVTNDRHGKPISGKVSDEFVEMVNKDYVYKDKTTFHLGYGQFDGARRFYVLKNSATAQSEYNNSVWKYVENYATIGGTQGNWYIGAAGEMTYLSIYEGELNSALDICKQYASITKIAVDESKYQEVGRGKYNDLAINAYWTSTIRYRLGGNSEDEFADAIVIPANGFIGWENERRNDNSHGHRVHRIRPLLMVDKDDRIHKPQKS